MLGLIFGLLLFCWKRFSPGSSNEESFLLATGFLFWWYLVTGVLQVIWWICQSALITGAGTAVGAVAGKWKGALIGFLAGGALSGFLKIRGTISIVLLISGSWLLSTVGTSTMTFSQYDTTRLGAGAALMLVGLLLSPWFKLSFSSGKRTTSR